MIRAIGRGKANSVHVNEGGEVTGRMGKRLAGKRGQAFVEYLVIIVLVIAALLALRVIVGPQLTATYNNAGAKTTTMAGNVLGSTPE